MSDSLGIESADLEEVSAEDLEKVALEKERDWYLSEDGFIDFARDSGAAPDAQFEPHGRYAPDILRWNGEPDPESDKTLYKFKLILWPRGSFKSAVFDVAYVCWLIANDPNIRILVASETEKQAKKFVTQAMNIIDSAWFRERFGVHRGKNWKEGSAEFYSALRTKKSVKEPTLIAAGCGNVWTGSHWDFVLMDDVMGDGNTKTDASLETAWDWFADILAQLDPGCRLLVIGTLWHHADIYCRLMGDKARSELFETSVHAWRNDDGSLFFPGRLTSRFVENQRLLMSPRKHACFYENKPFSDEQQMFKPSYFRVVEDHEVPAAVWTYILTDWAFVADEKKKKRPDRTAFWVISLDCNRVAYVRDLWIGQWKPNDSVRLCCTLWNEGSQAGWNMRGVTVEKTAHAELLSTVFTYVQRETFINPRFIEIGGRSQESKEMRIEASEPRWRRGDIYFTRSVREQYEKKWAPMFKEMTQWPLSEYDDVADAQSDLDKKNERGKFYCPAPPPGWRPPVAVRNVPSMVNGQMNPEYGYPARAMGRMGQRQEGQADLWLGRSSSTGDRNDPTLPSGHPANSDSVFSKPQSNQSIFRRRLASPQQSDRLW